MIKKYTKYLLLFSLFCLRIPFLDIQASEYDEIGFVFNKIEINKDDNNKYEGLEYLDIHDTVYVNGTPYYQSYIGLERKALKKLGITDTFFNKVSNANIKVSEAKKEINKIFSKIRFVKKIAGIEFNVKAYCKAIYNKDPFKKTGDNLEVLSDNIKIRTYENESDDKKDNDENEISYKIYEIYIDFGFYLFHPWEQQVVGFLLLALSIWGIVTYGGGEKAPAKENEGKKQAEAKKKAR